MDFPFLFLVLTLLLSASCATEQIEATDLEGWSIQVPKPGGATRRLSLEQIPLSDGITGAESLAFDRRGQGPYAGVSDGRILRWDDNANSWMTFAYNTNYKKHRLCADPARRSEDAERTCGRPLGLQFYSKTGDLYFADAYMGLMRVGPAGGVAEVVAAKDDGVPFNFTNGVDVDQVTGDVYFTDSSTNYPRARNTEIILNRDVTGRLLKYNDKLGTVDVLMANLPYPNGVTVSADRTHVVVAYAGPSEAHRYRIRGRMAGRYELLAELPGYPDNVRRDNRGGYWFALNRENVNTTNPGISSALGSTSRARSRW
jgi:sugar lactone lactonase YvrE